MRRRKIHASQRVRQNDQIAVEVVDLHVGSPLRAIQTKLQPFSNDKLEESCVSRSDGEVEEQLLELRSSENVL